MEKNISNLTLICNGCKAGLNSYISKLLESHNIDQEKLSFFCYLLDKQQKIYKLKPIKVFRCNNYLFGFIIFGKINAEFIRAKKINWSIFKIHEPMTTALVIKNEGQVAVLNNQTTKLNWYKRINKK